MINPLPNDKLLDQPNLKDSEDNKKLKLCFGQKRKHCGKKEKMLVTSISPFLTMFSTFFLWVVKSRDCMVKG